MIRTCFLALVLGFVRYCRWKRRGLSSPLSPAMEIASCGAKAVVAKADRGIAISTVTVFPMPISFRDADPRRIAVAVRSAPLSGLNVTWDEPGSKTYWHAPGC